MPKKQHASHAIITMTYPSLFEIFASGRMKNRGHRPVMMVNVALITSGTKELSLSLRKAMSAASAINAPFSISIMPIYRRTTGVLMMLYVIFGQHDIFHMVRVWKHVHRLYACDMVV